ncbi:hypothetical protein OsJ_17690 [Oryza sativa Japonica Group]|uniref:Uncharacterized protein n=1 Tax=Oryza sativa subsp. japonica TaxID=39947 RepID=B9FNC0_ORYSJ|nr:hypothetical protein OsJ_17690 [Oryza sativa Japonica Group]
MAPRILEKALHSDIADDVIRCNILPRLPFKLTTRLKVISSTPDIVGIPSGIGLAFDPVDKFQENTVSKFKIVKAVGARTIEDNGTKFCFATLSSNTSCWAMSSTTVYVDTKINCNNKKVAYGSGIMYWDYQEIVLWFDIATDMAGIVKIPWIQLGVEVKGPVHHDIDTSANGMLFIRCGVEVKGPVHHDIDTSANGMLVCTTIDKGGLPMYHLVGVNTDFNWEIKHDRRWIDMMKDSISAFGFCHSMQLHSGLQTNLIDAGSKPALELAPI